MSRDVFMPVPSLEPVPTHRVRWVCECDNPLPPLPPFPSSIWFSYQIQQTEQKIDISVTRQNVATES